jgi:hypothetical protein
MNDGFGQELVVGDDGADRDESGGLGLSSVVRLELSFLRRSQTAKRSRAMGASAASFYRAFSRGMIEELSMRARDNGKFF